MPALSPDSGVLLEDLPLGEGLLLLRRDQPRRRDHILPAAKANRDKVASDDLPGVGRHSKPCRLTPDIVQQLFVAGVTVRLGKLNISLTKRFLGAPNEFFAELLITGEILAAHKTAS